MVFVVTSLARALMLLVMLPHAFLTLDTYRPATDCTLPDTEVVLDVLAVTPGLVVKTHGYMLGSLAIRSV